jgi:hypothetical protein
MSVLPAWRAGTIAGAALAPSIGHVLNRQLDYGPAGAAALLLLLDVPAPPTGPRRAEGQDGAKAAEAMIRRYVPTGALLVATLLATAAFALQDAPSMAQAPIPGGFSLRALAAMLLGLAAAVVVVVVAHSAWAAKRLRGQPLQDADAAVRRLGDS